MMNIFKPVRRFSFNQTFRKLWSKTHLDPNNNSMSKSDSKNLGKLTLSKINAIVEKYKNKTKVDLVNSTTQTMSSRKWGDVNVSRIVEQTGYFMSTNLYNLLGFSDKYSTFIENWYLRKGEETKAEDWFNQYVCLPGMSFSTWLTYLFHDKIPMLFSFYDTLFDAINNGKIKDFNCDEHLNYASKGTTDMYNSINYCVDSNTLVVVYEGQFIMFQFKKLELNVHEAQTPGFHVLYSRYKKSRYCQEMKIKSKDIKQLSSELNFNTGDVKKEYYIKLIAGYLNVTPSEYADTLDKCNVMITSQKTITNQKECITNTDLNDLFYINDISKNKYIKLPSVNFLKERLHESNVDTFIWLNKKVFSNKYCIKTSLLFLYDRDIESELINNLGKNIVYTWLLHLYIALNDFTQPIKIYDGIKRDTFSIEINKSFNSNLIEYLNKNEYQFSEKSFYTWKNQNKNEKEFEKEHYVPFVNIPDEQVLQDNRSKWLLLLDKLFTGKIKNKEIRYLSLFFYYANKNTFQTSNIRVRSILNIIKKHPSKYKDFKEVLKRRYGGNANILCSLFIFCYCTKLNLGGINLIKDYPVYYLKDDYWLDITKKMSELVKSSSAYKEELFGMEDFKNLQYLDTFIGPLGNDGKSPLESISQRVYCQHRKQIFDPFSNNKKIDQFEKASLVCKLVFDKYWQEVLRNNQNKFEGIVKTIRHRDLFSTDSGSGGLRSPFYKKETTEYFEKNLDGGFLPDSANKKTGFISETDFWYERVIFDIPSTFCDMILKRKENGKYRYIYSVSIQHYLVNSIVTRHLEPSTNAMGIIINLNENNVISHNFDKNDWFGRKSKVFNCIDYSEFNDQHEALHKAQVWKSLYKAISEDVKYEEYKTEMLILCSWLAISTEKMFMRLMSDNSIVYEHKGRLFSGERSTTLINSLMSMFYFVLVNINYVGLRYELNPKTVPEEIKGSIKEIFEYGSFKDNNHFYKLLETNECLGDDGRAKNLYLIDAILFNESAVLSGLMLKLSKCLIGINCSEFLRKFEVKSNNEFILEITKGYGNRSIASLVCGNPEGTKERNYIAWITQIYELLTTLNVRIGYSQIYTELLEDSWEWISKLNQKNKEVNPVGLPKEILYISKKKNGLGFITFENTIYTIKSKLPVIPQPKSQATNYKGKVDIDSIMNKVREVDLPPLLKYGDIKPGGLAARAGQEADNIINGNNLHQFLYPPKFIEEFSKYRKNLENLVKSAKLVELKEEFKPQNYFKAFELLSDKLSVKTLMHIKKVTKTNERIQALERNLMMISTKYSFEQIVKSEYGEIAYIEYKLDKDFKNQDFLNDFIEPNILNGVLSAFYLLLKDDYKLKDIKYITRYVLKFGLHGVKAV